MSSSSTSALASSSSVAIQAVEPMASLPAVIAGPAAASSSAAAAASSPSWFSMAASVAAGAAALYLGKQVYDGIQEERQVAATHEIRRQASMFDQTVVLEPGMAGALAASSSNGCHRPWACSACTFENTPESSRCTICGTEPSGGSRSSSNASAIASASAPPIHHPPDELEPVDEPGAAALPVHMNNPLLRQYQQMGP
jgi:hypothetical protein